MPSVRLPQTQMLQPPYDIGARISTNSWGAVRTSYTTLDRQMDDFAYLKPDMVLVVAAGNCGDVISGCEYQVNEHNRRTDCRAGWKYPLAGRVSNGQAVAQRQRECSKNIFRGTWHMYVANIKHF